MRNLIPKRRFEEFKNSDPWEQRKLGDLADIVRGASPRPIQDPKWFDENSDIGWLRISDVTEQDGRICHLEQHISELGQEKTRVLTKPHLLLSIAATVGKPVVNYVKTGVHDGFLIFLNQKFDREFMFQWLEMFRPMWQKYGQSGSQVNLNSDIVKNQGVLLPSYKEQKKIGEFFVEIDNLITLHQRKLDKLKETKLAYLSEMFPKEGEFYPKRRFTGFTDPWEQRKIKDIFKVTRGHVLAVTKTAREKTISTPYPVYSSQTTDQGLMGYYNDYLYSGAITWTTDGANAGTVNYREGKFYCTNVCGVLISEEGYANKMISEALNKVAWKHVSKVGNPKLMNNVMSEIVISIPRNMKEQSVISNFFGSLDNLITLHQRKLDKLQALKQAYLSEMFV